MISIHVISFASEYDEGITKYTQILELNPNDAKTYYRRGIAYWRAG
jgi:hypothetical protein